MSPQPGDAVRMAAKAGSPPGNPNSPVLKAALSTRNAPSPVLKAVLSTRNAFSPVLNAVLSTCNVSPPVLNVPLSTRDASSPVLSAVLSTRNAISPVLKAALSTCNATSPVRKADLGTCKTTPTPMHELSTAFARLSHIDLFARAHSVLAALGSDPAAGYFPDPQPPLAVLAAAADALGEAISMADCSAATALRHARREPVITSLTHLARNLETTARGDIPKLSASGYGLCKTPVRSTAPPAPPTRLRLKPGPIPGSVIASCQRSTRKSALALELSPNADEGPWTSGGVFTNSRHMLATGLPPVSRVYARVRAIGSMGPGGWSGIASTVVL